MSERSRRIASLSSKKRALLAKRLRAKAKSQATSGPEPIPRRTEAGPARLSFAQERFWFLDQWQPGNPAYNILDVVRVRGRLDIACFGGALREVLRRHEALRTVFREVEEVPHQEVRPTPSDPLHLVDLQALPEARRDAVALALGRRESRTGFDLARGPLLRATLVQLGEESFLLLLNLHHIVSDLWSFGILIHEWTTLYGRLLAGDRSPLPELEIQYADFAVWQRRELEGGAVERQLDYWKKELDGAPLVFELPTDRPRPPQQTARGARQIFDISPASTAGLRSLGQRSGGTLFMVLQAAYSALLHRYTGRRDFLLGSPVAGRSRRQLESLIGVFINTLVLRNRLQPDQSFEEYLGQVRESSLGALAHQDFPFERLVDVLDPERDLSRPPVVQLFFALQNAPTTSFELPGVHLEVLEQDVDAAKFDVSLTVVEVEDRLFGTWTYSTDLFDAATLSRMTDHLTQLLEGIVEDPARPVGALPLMSPAERMQLRGFWRGPDPAGLGDGCLHDRVARHARTHPTDPAVRDGDTLWTYTDLDARAEALAHRLLDLGLGPEDRVGLFLDLDRWLLVGLLGVGKAGGAFLPLDPTFPAERLGDLAREAGVSIVLCRDDHRPSGALGELGVVALDSVLESPPTTIDHPPLRPVHPDALAYVLYTSGSTGRPKGVMVRHGSVMGYLGWFNGEPMAGESLLLPAVTRPSFDGSFRQILAPLARGGTVWFPRAAASDPEALLAELAEPSDVALGLSCVPSLWTALLDMADALGLRGDPFSGRLRRLFLGGEAVSDALLARSLERVEALDIWNCYGPTEITVNATANRLRRDVPVTIGRPLEGVEILVVDPQGRPVPTGVPGQLMVAGSGVARGYLDRPDLTAERFLPHPDPTRPGDRVYATGDRVRTLPDGEIEFLGRIDDQVKLRGFRIEPGEIAAVLGEQPGVDRAVVLVRDTAPGQPNLVAYASPLPGDTLDEGELLAALATRLPAYMVPVRCLILDVFPLTGTGKLDPRALPDPKPAETVHKVLPRTPTEERLADIWRQVLGVPEVGVREDFFALGGHSLLAAQAMARIRQAFQVDLPLRTLFESPTIEELAGRCEELAGRCEGQDDAADVPLEPVPRQGDLPLSFAQERLWFLDRLEPGSAAYGIPNALRLRGPLDADALERAFAEVVQRHEVLRTVYRAPQDTPVQWIVPTGPASGDDAGALPVFERVDLRNRPPAEREPTLWDMARQRALRPFDLEHGPVLRLCLVCLDTDDHGLLVDLHHIAGDGGSLGVLLGELSALYGAFVDGRPSPLEPLRIQYVDYALWQRQRLTGDTLEREIEWWQRALEDVPSILELPTDRPRPAVQTFVGATRRQVLSASLATALGALAEEHRSTLFMVLMAAFQGLLHRLTGQPRFVVGSPVAGRDHSDLEGLIGLFVNTLALPAAVDPEAPLESLVDRTRDRILDVFEHQEVPFERLVDALNLERDTSRPPLVQTVFTVQTAPRQTPELSGLTVEELDLEGETSKFDLTVAFLATDGGLEGAWEYNTDLFDPSTIDRFLGYFERFLTALVETPERSVGEVSLLSETELHQLTVGVNETAVEYPRDVGLGDLVGRWVDRTPDALAVDGTALDGTALDGNAADATLTYAELGRRAEALAHRLRAAGVRPGDRVGLAAARDLGLPVAMLGIVMAGAAYVPLDGDYPPERLVHMAEDSGLVAIVAGDLATAANLPDAVTDRVDRVLVLGDTAGASDAGTLPTVSGGAVAHVIYTSGSTGRPKGVLIPHRGVSRLALGADYLQIRPGERMTQISNIAFDAATLEIWPTLLSGGCLVILSRDQVLDVERLGDTLKDHRIDHIFLTSALFHRVAQGAPAAFDAVSTVLFGGEAADRNRVAEVLTAAPSTRVVNLYGPTETTVLGSWHPLSSADLTGPIPIGRPLSNSRAQVLDAAMRPVPTGVAGELCLGGDGLALGYLGRPALTATAFVPDPHAKSPGDRLYRTGDRVRWRGDGVLEFLGRVDAQVKIRGFRIELGEVEAALSSHSGVSMAAVTVHTDGRGERRLVAYAVAKASAPELSSDGLRAALEERLPAFMVPAHILRLDAMPLTPNGKVDRRQLPAPDDGDLVDRRGSGSPLRTPAEELMAGLWAEVLGVDTVWADDHFFELGGHSLLATQLMSRIRRGFEVDLPLRDLFESPTLRALTERVAHAAADQPSHPAPPLVPVPRGGTLPLSFAQERLWFLDRLEPGSTAYNIPLALRIHGALDGERLGEALAWLLERHEVLRTTFGDVRGVPHQIIQDVGGVNSGAILERRDLTALGLDAGDAAREAAVRKALETEAARPFDLETGPVLRATLLTLSAEEHVLAVILHHIAGDGWSVGILLREWMEAYRALAEGQEPTAESLPVQYADFSGWQREWLRDEALEAAVEPWRQRLDGAVTSLALPIDRPATSDPRRRAGHHAMAFDAGTQDRLEALCREHHVTLFMAMLALMQAFLHRVTGQDDLSVGTPVAGRNRLEVEGLIGFFANTLVLRSDPGPWRDLPFVELLALARESTLMAHRHQDVPFEKLVEILQPERHRGQNPFFQAMLTVQHAEGPAVEIPGLRLEGVDLDNPETKFELLLRLTQHDDGLTGAWSYNADRLDAVTVDRLAEAFQRMLTAALDDPERPIGSLPWLSDGARQQLLHASATAAAASSVSTDTQGLHHLLEVQMARDPEAVAVTALGDGTRRSMTWRQLEARSRHLAHRLQERSVGPEVAVGLCAERSLEMVVGMVAILRAGGAFVPLDPAYPAAHLAVILEELRPAAVVAQDTCLASVPLDALPAGRDQILTLHGGDGGPWAEDALSTDGSLSLDPPVEPDHLAYLIYTSGSTGRPKGVMAPHRAIVNHVLARQAEHPLAAGDRVLQQAPFGFEMALWEIFWPLITGAELVLARPGGERDPGYLASVVAEEAITALRFTPSMLALVLERSDDPPTALRYVFTGAESLTLDLDRYYAERWPGELHHLYGPTETCVAATLFRHPVQPFHPKVPIGESLAGASLFVAETAADGSLGDLVPPGVAGELLIGGPGLARGYHGQPAKTAERFVPHPWGSPGERLYRTGDRVRRLPDGQLDFLGRIDHQVKVRGFRVEPEHVEAVLRQHPAVQGAAVLHDPTGDGRLVAWWVGDGSGDGSGDGADAGAELRTFLRQRLPEPMVPARIEALEALPRTHHGKVDRRSLAARLDTLERVAAPGGTPPRDALEKTLADLWGTVLGLADVGVDQDFFDLGGHSLMAVRLMAAIEEELGRALPLSSLFAGGTVSSQAQHLRDTADGGPQESPLVTLSEGDGTAPLFCVHPVGGEVLCYRELAQELGMPVFGLQRTEITETSIEALARRYMDEIRAVRPEGPYRLAGWSMGALVAFEMAHLCRSEGQEVELLALVDPPAPRQPDGQRRTNIELLEGFGHDLAGLGHGAAIQAVLAAHGAEGVMAALLDGEGEVAPELRPWRRPFALYRTHARAMETYGPDAVLDGRLELFLARDEGVGDDGARGWRGRTLGEPGIHLFDGGHYDLLRRPRVADLATRLNACLDLALTGV